MSQSDQASERQGRVTILDVAAAAGVSKSTVSRVLDERLPRSENATAQRVRQIAAELGYFRDVSAASLRRGKTSTIGVIVPRLTDTVMAMLYEALARACVARGLFAIVATTNDDPQADRSAADQLLRQGVDGLVLATTRDDDDMTRELAERGVHYVLALRTDGASLSSVGDDNLGGYLATRHLIDLGHRRIGIIAGPDYASSSRGRLAGYRRAMAEAGVEVDPAWVAPSSFDIDSGAAAAERLVATGAAPTAIFAINDNTAIGAMSRLTQMGLSVPDDISLAGYNDIPIVRRLSTPLTTVHVPFDQIASSALELLAAGAIFPGERVRRAIPTLIPRKSTAPAKAPG